MCGIAGILNIHSDRSLDIPIKAMTDAIAHRGPDSGGYYVETNMVALGHRRLSIIDLSTGANQPFKSDDARYTLIFNGEIYNYLEVKPLLPEYAFKTTSDTEVILAAYIKWGAECLQYFNGMFAFAIWDKIEQTLFVARDRLGIKPLYYYCDQQQFIFSSELRSMLSSGFIERQLDRDALRDYLVLQSVYAPGTIIQDVFQLMPGEYAIVSAAGMHKATYWSVETPPRVEVSDKLTTQNTVKELLSASIERRMISDVPLGAFLSGGIDSSAVVALMAQCTERPIDTFTIGFSEKQYDESKYADVISKKYNTHHTTIVLSPEDFLKELPAALNAMDSPSGDGLNTYVVSKATKNAGVTVALSGLGGDELFAGYQYFPYYRQINSAVPLYWSIPKGVRRAFMSVAHKAFSSNQKLGRLVSMLDVNQPSIGDIYPYFRLINTESEANKLLNKYKVQSTKYAGQNTRCEVRDTSCEGGRSNDGGLTIRRLLEERKAKISKLPLMSQVTVAETLGYTLNVLLKDTDQFSMASALEVREPFFDYRLVEYVLSVPDKFKYERGSPKSLLVSSLGALLPDEIVNRPKKGFVFPWKHWLLDELKPFCQKYIDILSNYEVFDKGAVQAEWASFVQSKGERGSYVKIWQLVVLSHWLHANQIAC